MQRMTRKFLFVGANGSMRPLLISLPMIEPLLDGVRYFRLEDRPTAPGSGFHVGKPSREKLAQALRSQNTQRELVMPNPPPRTPRAPSLRSLVKLAVRCESAEELGKKLKRRFDRQKQRRGIEPGRDRAAEAELDHLLGE